MSDAAGVIRDLVSLRERRETGVLEVRYRDVRAFVYLDKGEPVFAEHGTLGDTLGRVLLRMGTLDQEAYAHVVRTMTSELVSNEQMRFGEVAVELGYLTHEQMCEALAAQVQQKVLTCMQWEEPERVFVQGPDALEGIARFPCSLDRLVMTAVGLFDEERLARVLAPHLDRFIEVRSALSELEQRLLLSGAERHVVRQIRGRKRLRHLLASAGDRELAARLVATLVLLDLVALRESAPASMQPVVARRARVDPGEPMANAIREATRSHSELPLATRPSAPPSPPAASDVHVVAGPPRRRRPEAPQASETRPRNVAPPRPKPAGPPRAVALLARDLEARAARAPSTDEGARLHLEYLVQRARERALPSPERAPLPPPATDRERRLSAELAMRAGRARMAASQWKEALEEFRRAQALDPEAQEYGLYVLWAERQVCADEAKLRELRAELVREAAAHVRRDPHFGFAYYVIGAVRMDEGEIAKAEKALQKAIELDAANRDAERRLRILHLRMKKK